ncbi:DUF1697 domain-containing protein [Sphingomonas sp.]|uniref:DUF1697 domain-containing protein n=1 Tax=Sphingomonas sp. TaxID=28214 RepID=UPI002DED614C|nr:DUF1697 domain-containing protein [Sphingomonas sp.]
MTAYVALLRAVNVGGLTLPMAELKAICDAAGFANARTYIASGNAVFASDLTESEVKTQLEPPLAAFAGKPIPVILRTAEEMKQVLDANPFPVAEPKFNYVLFLDSAPAPDAISSIRHRTAEEISAGTRELYIHYPTGMGKSKLVVPTARSGTARNMNTVARLAEMAAELG